MIEGTLLKRRHVLEYDKEHAIDDGVVVELLKTAWKLTPSKNNFMPYSVFVLGPKRQQLKEALYRVCVGHAERIDRFNMR